MFTDDLPLQDNYTTICNCSQKCDRVTYEVRTSQAPISDSVIATWIFSDYLPDLAFSVRNLRHWANLDFMNRNFTLHINKISRMYLQLRQPFYNLLFLLRSTPTKAYSSPDRFQCVASSLPSYEESMANFMNWEMSSYYLDITATYSNNPRTDDFLTRLAYDIISQSNEMDRFIIELNDMLGTFRLSVEALLTCFGTVAMAGQELIIAQGLKNASSAINSSSSSTLAINDSYTELSYRIRSHRHFSWLRRTTDDDIHAVMR